MVVKTWKDSSSMILDNPKSAIRSSESSEGVRKRRFSGLRSILDGVFVKRYLDEQFRDHGGRILQRQ